MFCPQCESEYVEGISDCPVCGVALVDELQTPADPEHEFSAAEPVIVFSSYDAGLVAIAKSILQSSEITYGVVGEEVQDLFGYGRFPAGGNVFIGPIKLLVAAEDAPDATELLSVLSEDDAVVNDDAGLMDDAGLADEEPGASWWGTVRTLGKMVAALVLALMLIEAVWLLVQR